jgi:hypothetical protein
MILSMITGKGALGNCNPIDFLKMTGNVLITNI